jgi:hypothetical protein
VSDVITHSAHSALVPPSLCLQPIGFPVQDREHGWLAGRATLGRAPFWRLPSCLLSPQRGRKATGTPPFRGYEDPGSQRRVPAAICRVPRILANRGPGRWCHRATAWRGRDVRRTTATIGQEHVARPGDSANGWTPSRGAGPRGVTHGRQHLNRARAGTGWCLRPEVRGRGLWLGPLAK